MRGAGLRSECRLICLLVYPEGSNDRLALGAVVIIGVAVGRIVRENIHGSRIACGAWIDTEIKRCSRRRANKLRIGENRVSIKTACCLIGFEGGEVRIVVAKNRLAVSPKTIMIRGHIGAEGSHRNSGLRRKCNVV